MPDLVEVPTGQPVELEVTVTVDGTPTDPTAGQAFSVRQPDGTITSLGAGTNQGGDSGVVTVVYDSPPEEGDYWWSFASTTPKTWQQHLFVAVQNRVTNGALSDVALTTAAHARVYVKRRLNAQADPELLDLLINSYSQAVMRYCDRQFRPLEEATVKTFTYTGNGYLSLAPYDLRTITELTLDGTASTDYQLVPRSQTGEGTYLAVALPLLDPLAVGYELTIEGDWGCETIPADIEMATLIAVADGFRNPEGGATRTVGELEYTEVAEPIETRGRALPSDARALLGPFNRVGI